jgi:hypothetical protein
MQQNLLNISSPMSPVHEQKEAAKRQSESRKEVKGL